MEFSTGPSFRYEGLVGFFRSLLEELGSTSTAVHLFNYLEYLWHCIIQLFVLALMRIYMLGLVVDFADKI